MLFPHDRKREQAQEINRFDQPTALCSCCCNLNRKAMSTSNVDATAVAGFVKHYVTQFAATTACNLALGGTQDGAGLAAVKSRQIGCGITVPAIQAAASYVVHQFTSPGETYSASRLLYDAAGILGGGSLPRAFESAPRAAFASTLSSVESTIKAFAAVQTYAHMTSDPAAESDSKIETKA